MEPTTAHRNLLIGLYALRAGMLSSAQFEQAIRGTIESPGMRIEDFLLQRKWIDRDVAELIASMAAERMVEAARRQPPVDETTIRNWNLDSDLCRVLHLHEDTRRPSADECDLHAALPTGHASADQGHPNAPLPDFGRYVARRLLGQGGFASVYLAYDPVLNRDVAIKVLNIHQLQSNTMDRLLLEAKTIAELDHPHIVRVYDAIQPTESSPYRIVMAYCAGGSLQNLLDQRHVDEQTAVRWLIQIADAVQYVHQEHGLIHRDLKPANVLLTRDQRVCVTDFGLAIGKPGLLPRELERVGTPKYMAPEMVRGESHNMDIQIDVWAFGVTMYQLLTRRTPFNGGTDEKVFAKIQQFNPIPLRHFVAGLSRELERICLCCLIKSRRERYHNMSQVLEDLRAWDGGATSSPVGSISIDDSNYQIRSTVAVSARTTTDSQLDLGSRIPVIVPKGLRSFDTGDAAFFLDLLPGPRDRHGIPEPVRFWLQRLSPQAPNPAIPIGLMYGPSGCGKSSLMKAGILPRLADEVERIYVEATTDGTESRLRHVLAGHFPTLPHHWSLPDMLAAFRQGSMGTTKKLVIVIDQLEQWLHSRRRTERKELVDALRQCDGTRTQAVIMVRDDFWMQAGELMNELDTAIDVGTNALPVDLFSISHARKVLAAFGRAYGALPSADEPLSEMQQSFIKQAVSELAEHQKVVCVHLAIFSQMMSNREWTPATLRAGGGAQGVAVRFLDEILGDSSGSPRAKNIAASAIPILKCLLPERGSRIRGRMVDGETLAKAAQLDPHGRWFRDVIHMLDHELRLITPTFDGEHSDPHGAKYYQLTHDFLVLPLRRWLRRRQSAHWRGRAELCLEERTSQWKIDRSRRFLPSPAEFAAIWLGVPLEKRSLDQKSMLRLATQYYLVRIVLLATVLAVCTVGLLWLRDRQHRRFVDDQIASLLQAHPASVPTILQTLTPYRHLAVGDLLRQRQAGDGSKQLRITTSLMVLDPRFRRYEMVASILKHVPTVEPSECRNIAAALQSHAQVSRDAIYDQMQDGDSPLTTARWAVLLVVLRDPTLFERNLAFAPDPTKRVTTIHELTHWHTNLGMFLDLLEASSDAAVVSGVSKALGLLPPNELSTSERQRAVRRLRQLYQQSPFASVHGAVEFALKRWGETIPTVRQVPPGSEWFTNTLGLTFCLVRPDSDMEANASFPPLYFAATEIPCEVFVKFIAELAADDPHRQRLSGWPNGNPIPHQPSGPAAFVTYFEALRFCNWMSQREGRRPYYVNFQLESPAEVSGKTTVLVEWCDVDEQADGYRLPPVDAFVAACRAGTTTTYTIGDLEMLDILPQYEYCHSNSHKEGKITLMPCGTLLPNDLGMYDMLGNALEWIGSASPDHPMAQLIGSSVAFSHTDARVSPAFPVPVKTMRGLAVGMRIVCPAP